MIMMIIELWSNIYERVCSWNGQVPWMWNQVQSGVRESLARATS